MPADRAPSVLITGIHSELGFAVSHRFRREGWFVIGCDHGTTTGRNARVHISADLTEEADCARAARRASLLGNGIDCHRQLRRRAARRSRRRVRLTGLGRHDGREREERVPPRHRRHALPPGVPRRDRGGRARAGRGGSRRARRVRRQPGRRHRSRDVARDGTGAPEHQRPPGGVGGTDRCGVGRRDGGAGVGCRPASTPRATSCPSRTRTRFRRRPARRARPGPAPRGSADPARGRHRWRSPP